MMTPTKTLFNEASRYFKVLQLKLLEVFFRDVIHILAIVSSTTGTLLHKMLNNQDAISKML